MLFTKDFLCVIIVVQRSVACPIVTSEISSMKDRTGIPTKSLFVTNLQQNANYHNYRTIPP